MMERELFRPLIGLTLSTTDDAPLFGVYLHLDYAAFGMIPNATSRVKRKPEMGSASYPITPPFSTCETRLATVLPSDPQ